MQRAMKLTAPWAVMFLLASSGGRGWADDWPSVFHDPQRTSRTVDGVNFPLELKWERPAAAVTRGLVVSGGIVYHVHDDYGAICAVDAQTGDELWRYTPYGPNIEPSPMVANGIVFMCPVYENRTIQAVDALTGAPVWESAETVRRATGYPLAANGRLYVFAISGLSVFDQNSGTRVWHQGIDAGPGGALSEDEGTVFCTGEHGHLYAYDALNGDLLWDYPSAGDPWPGWSVMANPIVVGDMVLYGGGAYGDDGGANGIIAVDAETGGYLWMIPSLPGNGNRSGYAVANDILYSIVHTIDGVYAYDLTTADPVNHIPPQRVRVLQLPETTGEYKAPIIYNYDADLGHTVVARASDQAAVCAFRFDTMTETWTEVACQDLVSSIGGAVSAGRLYLMGSGVDPIPDPSEAPTKLHAFGPAALEVLIDIKPGSYPNSINLGANGVVPVAVLSSTEFDATTIKPDTISLAGAGVAVRGKGNKFLSHHEDVNGDGLLDLVCQVETVNLDPDTFQDGIACLEGQTVNGNLIEGWDEIRIVPPE